jgi:hypothetical protein
MINLLPEWDAHRKDSCPMATRWTYLMTFGAGRYCGVGTRIFPCQACRPRIRNLSSQFKEQNFSGHNMLVTSARIPESEFSVCAKPDKVPSIDSNTPCVLEVRYHSGRGLSCHPA